MNNTVPIILLAAAVAVLLLNSVDRKPVKPKRTRPISNGRWPPKFDEYEPRPETNEEPIPVIDRGRPSETGRMRPSPEPERDVPIPILEPPTETDRIDPDPEIEEPVTDMDQERTTETDEMESDEITQEDPINNTEQGPPTEPDEIAEEEQEQHVTDDLCGIPHSDHKPDLTGEPNAKKHSWPWLVLLRQTTYNEKKGRDEIWDCAASIIPVEGNKRQSNILVTTANCITVFELDEGSNTTGKAVLRNANEFKAHIGVHHINDLASAKMVRVTKFFPHKDYYGKTGIMYMAIMHKFQNDIALVKLAEPIEFGEKVRPICLPEQSAAPDVGTQCMLTGWPLRARSTDLRQLKVTVQPADYCRDNNAPSEVSNEEGSWGMSYNDTVTFCAAPRRDSGPTTPGEPLACYDETVGRWKLLGMMLVGETTTRSRNPPPLFTRVARYADWIATTIPKVLKEKTVTWAH